MFPHICAPFPLGTGLLDTCNKLINNSEHSHIGLVVAMPNKLNGSEELFVMEMTNNLDKMYFVFFCIFIFVYYFFFFFF